MVKVINAVPHVSVVKRCICKNCGSELEYVPQEVMVNFTSDYTGGKDYYKYITCPSCNKEVIV
jgi:RNase P subunit RPR2